MIKDIIEQAREEVESMTPGELANYMEEIYVIIRGVDFGFKDDWIESFGDSTIRMLRGEGFLDDVKRERQIRSSKIFTIRTITALRLKGGNGNE